MTAKSIARFCPATALVGLALAALQPVALAQTAAPSTPDRKAFLKRILPAIASTQTQLALAKSLGVERIRGRRVDRRRTALMEFDHDVTSGFLGIGDQNEPSIAVNPLDPGIVAVFAQNTYNLASSRFACSLYLSFDGGQSYTYDSDAQLVTPTNHFCSDPVVRFSPDGQQLYLSYMDVDDQTLVGDPSDDTDTVRVEARDGFDPSTPGVISDVFTGTALSFVDKPWLDVHTWDADGSGAPYVYVTATRLNTDNTCDIVFSRNTLYGQTAWDPLVVLATSASCDVSTPTATLTARLLQGSRPAGGPGTQVLVCWYDSGADGWSTFFAAGTVKLNKFNIACRSSNDRGATFFGGVTPPDTANPTNWILAAKDVANEVPFYLGPVPPEYERWWGSEFPAIAIDHLGNAHIAFTYDPTSSADDAESGNVAYIKSTFVPTATVPYAKWSAKVALGAGSLAQGFPTIAAQRIAESTKPVIWLGYVDCFRSSALGTSGKNAIYDVRLRKSTTGGPTFGAAVTVTDHSSLSDSVYLGDYIDSAAGYLYHIAWTSNATARLAADDVSDIFTDRY